MIRIELSSFTEAYEWFRQRRGLDLEPPYQRRGGLRDKNAKAFLIDSMLNGFDVPKFYVADLALLPQDLRSSGKTHAVIDGKQRFETLFDWFSGSLLLNRDFVLFEDPALELGGLTVE